MIDKPKTDIEELFKNPKNGKYLKVVARKHSIHLEAVKFVTFHFNFSDGSILQIRISCSCSKVRR